MFLCYLFAPPTVLFVPPLVSTRLHQKVGFDQIFFFQIGNRQLNLSNLIERHESIDKFASASKHQRLKLFTYTHIQEHQCNIQTGQHSKKTGAFIKKKVSYSSHQQ